MPPKLKPKQVASVSPAIVPSAVANATSVAAPILDTKPNSDGTRANSPSVAAPASVQTIAEMKGFDGPPPPPPPPSPHAGIVAASGVADPKSKVDVVLDDRAGTDVNTESKVGLVDCLKQASVYGTVPPKCINPEAVPELRKLVEAAIIQPLASAGGEFATDVLKATGNEALVQAALATALTPEQAAMLQNVSNDPILAAKLQEIQNKLSDAVTKSIDAAKLTVAPQLEKASGDVVNGVVVSIMNAVSDIPGVGFFLSLLGMVDTGVKALEQAQTIRQSAIQAAAPVTDALSEVKEVTDAVSAATVPKIPPGASIEMQPMGLQNKAEKEGAEKEKKGAEKEGALPAPQLVENNPQKPVDPNQSREQTNKEEERDNANLGGGGSRKRRRIYKLSRRIERTLRRVQKKYGLKDKNSFLRRTLHKKRK
jgi:hypothetical protein